MAKTKKADKAPVAQSQQVEIIDEKAVVSIKVSTSFFQRLQMIYLGMLKDKSNEEIEKFLEKVKNQTIDTEEDYHLETLLIILSEFQKNAKAEGFTRVVSQEELKKLTEEKLSENVVEEETQK
jgi:hypothetical protein